MRVLTVVFFLLAASRALAADPYVPPELEPWREWVLHGHEDVACPLSAEQRLCLWPGRFELTASERDAEFRQRVDSRIEQPYPLPVAGKHAPLDVRIDGRPATVLSRNGRAYVTLPARAVELTGRFAWDVRPATVTLPSGTGRVALTLDGRRIERPRWDGAALYLGRPVADTEPSAVDRVDLAVYRVLADGAPPTMRVTLRLDVAGTRRELTLGKVLPQGFEPYGLSSPLPARLDNDGQLQVQVTPGQWVIELTARTAPPLARVAFEADGEYWPDEEIWSYAEAPTLRVTEPDAANPVDPSQVGVAPRDRQLPAFLLRPGDSLGIVERQRGFSPDARNELTLARTLWLSFDRQRFVVRDDLRGTLRRDWRLDVAEPLVLQSARSGQDNLLVTRSAEDGLRGVEVRQPSLLLDAVSHIDAVSGPLPVSGWQTDVSDVAISVNLPPGHRLLAALNVDRVRGDWASRWDLLDFFLVLVVAALLWRSQARWLGVAALLALVLTIHETGAPAWSWLLMAALVGALGVLPEGRLRAGVRAATAVAFVGFALIAIPFVASQVTQALYPQLNQLWTHGDIAMDHSASVNEAPALEQVVVTSAPMEDVVAERIESTLPVQRKRVLGSSATNYAGQRAANRYASDVQVQAGPGLPRWGSGSNRLSWSGPVAPDQTFRLLILPAWAVSLWRLLGVALMLVVIGALARRFGLSLLKMRAAAGAAPAAAALLGIALLAPPPSAQAERPAPELLDVLQQRLLAPPECVPECVAIERARIRASEQTLRVQLVAHADQTVALALPGDPAGWHATRVSIDGASADGLTLYQGRFQLLLEPGVHRIELAGPLPAAPSVTVAFPQVPGDVEFAGEGWDASGLDDRRLTAGALTLARISDVSTDEATFDAMDVERFPVFVRVDRHLVFDLDWTVATTITRVTPPTAAINVAVPLLPDEAVNREDLTIVNGIAQVALAPGQRQLTWQSTLTRTSPVRLVAAADAPWQERWLVEAGPNWRLRHEGVPPDNRDPAQNATWQIGFTPWPGETLQLNVTRPAPVDGPTLALDQVELVHEIGRRGATSTLAINYRATQGGQHTITLPAGSELTELSLDDERQARGLDGAALTLPIVPGTHRLDIAWRSDDGGGLAIRGEPVELGIDAANVTTRMNLPRDRWILWTSGPRQGPAVLYWSELIVLILAAVALGRLTRTPLGVTSWLLLGLGFSTFFWPSLAVIVATLLAYRWREKTTLAGRTAFNAAQVGLAILFGLSALALLATIPFGLLGKPNMHIRGNGSYGHSLNWFVDHVSSATPDVSVLSAPLWVYKGLILLWSLWLALAVLRWLPWMWRAWTRDGHWRHGKQPAGSAST